MRNPSHISSPTREILVAVAVLAAVLAGPAGAQEAPFNASQVSNFDQAGQAYADIWGDGDFAYIAHFGQRVVDIIDITDPANPVLAATYDTNISAASAQDVKVGDGLMFVGLEGVSPGCHIVDVRDPYMPVKLTDVTVLSAVHNVFYDQGWLYLVDSGTNIIDVVDLRSFDPDAAPTSITTRQWRMTGVGNQFVHDITVQGGRLYASAWDSIRVYDVSDVANTEPSFLGSAPGSSVHAAWASDDGRFLVVGEEHSVSGLTLYEVSDGGSSVDLEVRGYYFVSSLRAGSVHNVVVVGNRVYVSWYAAGVQVLEIDPVTATWSLVASFDTTADDGSASTFAGNWGVYPFLGADKILASDRGNGLFVIDVDPNVLRFRYPNGLPRIVDPGVETPIELVIAPVGAPPLTTGVERHAVVDGGPSDDQTLTDQGGNAFAGTLPAAGCGSVIEVSFSAENTLGATFVDPPAAPAESYRVDVATDLTPFFEDDFEADLGWTVDNVGVSDGGWERDDPRGTGAQPENDATGAGDGSCFFTKQGTVGGSIGSDDVDGGPTRLISPALDFSSGGGLISYSYWLFNDDEDDALTVEISNNGVDWILARTYESLLGGWREDSFHTDEYVAPSDQIQVRFSVADNPNNSITEAAIDSFQAATLTCTIPIFEDGFESGDTDAWSAVVP